MTQPSGFTFERLDKNNTVSWHNMLVTSPTYLHHQVLLVVDHQIGLSELVRDYGVVEFRNNILAHAALGNLFNLPTILTSSAEQGKFENLG